MPRQLKRKKPYIIVFCEGESEQAYIDFLKRNLRMLQLLNALVLRGFSKKLITNSRKTNLIEIMRM